MFNMRLALPLGETFDTEHLLLKLLRHHPSDERFSNVSIALLYLHS